jgi:hypothetical protein
MLAVAVVFSGCAAPLLLPYAGAIGVGAGAGVGGSVIAKDANDRKEMATGVVGEVSPTTMIFLGSPVQVQEAARNVTIANGDSVKVCSSGIIVTEKKKEIETGFVESIFGGSEMWSEKTITFSDAGNSRTKVEVRMIIHKVMPTYQQDEVVSNPQLEDALRKSIWSGMSAELQTNTSDNVSARR